MRGRLTSSARPLGIGVAAIAGAASILAWSSDAQVTPLPVYEDVVGGIAAYEVQPRDSLASVAARYGVTADGLARANGLKSTSGLRPGQMLQIENVHIVPARSDAAIIINVPQRMLFFLGPAGPVGYPVAVGKSDWPTPTGRFRVLVKEEQPTWDVPPSIQEEMRQRGQKVITKMPPCPENPLGEYWLGLSLPGIGIHGTIAPLSIYRITTHGCVRLHPDDIRDLFERVEVGAAGEVVYEPLLIAVVDGRVLLEVHRDAYRRASGNWETLVRQTAASIDCAGQIDWTVVQGAIKRKEGVARVVATCE